MTYTDEKVNLVINKMTQEQYERAKEEGILNDNELYITPDQDIEIPTKTSELENDSGFITQEAIPTNISYFQNDQGYIDAGGKSEIQSDYEQKIYELKTELETQISEKANTVDIPNSVSQLSNDMGFITQEEVPTKVSELENDSGYITQEAVPTKTSQLSNDSSFVTTSQMNTAISKKSIVQGILLVSGDEYVIQGTGGGYDHKNMTISEIVNAYLTNGFVLYQGGNTNNDRLWEVANYSTTATTKWITFQNITRDSTTGEFMVWYGTYTGNGTFFTQTTASTRIVSKTNLPKVMRDNGFITQEAIPTNISYFQNDQGYIDAAGRSEIQSDYDWKINELKTNLEIQIGQKADTTDVPTLTSQLENDNGFITQESVPTFVSQLSNDSGYITIDDVPTQTSQLVNDSGFITEATYEYTDDTMGTSVRLVKDAYGKWSVENDVGIDKGINALMVVKTNDGVKMYQPTDAYYDPERTEHMETWWELGDWEHSGSSVNTIRDELLNYTWSDTVGHMFTNTDIKWYADEESYMGNNTYQIFILKVIDDNGQTKVGEFGRENMFAIPTKTSDLVNDSFYTTSDEVDAKINDAIGQVLTTEEF